MGASIWILEEFHVIFAYHMVFELSKLSKIEKIL